MVWGQCSHSNIQTPKHPYTQIPIPIRSRGAAPNILDSQWALVVHFLIMGHKIKIVAVIEVAV